MVLRARVNRSTGQTKHFRVHVTPAGEFDRVRIPTALSLALEQVDGAWYLLRLDAEGAVLADTWHATVEEAMAQAHFEFATEPTDWTQASA